MTQEGHAPYSLSRKSLLLWTGAAALIGALIVFGAVLPAEFNRDPLGIGKATGLSRLWAPAQVQAAGSAEQPASHAYPAPFRTDEIVIPLNASGAKPPGKSSLEYKVRMRAGETLIYSWSAEGVKNPDDLFFDMHGHTAAAPGQKSVTVADYLKGRGVSANGAITAPFDGIHGLYLRNTGATLVKVRLKLAGYYELIAPGQEGNLEGLLATPTDASR